MGEYSLGWLGSTVSERYQQYRECGAQSDAQDVPLMEVDRSGWGAGMIKPEQARWVSARGSIWSIADKPLTVRLAIVTSSIK